MNQRLSLPCFTNTHISIRYINKCWFSSSLTFTGYSQQNENLRSLLTSHTALCKGFCHPNSYNVTLVHVSGNGNNQCLPVPSHNCNFFHIYTCTQLNCMWSDRVLLWYGSGGKALLLTGKWMFYKAWTILVGNHTESSSFLKNYWHF